MHYVVLLSLVIVCVYVDCTEVLMYRIMHYWKKATFPRRALYSLRCPTKGARVCSDLLLQTCMLLQLANSCSCCGNLSLYRIYIIYIYIYIYIIYRIYIFIYYIEMLATPLVSVLPG